MSPTWLPVTISVNYQRELTSPWAKMTTILKENIAWLRCSLPLLFAAFTVAKFSLSIEMHQWSISVSAHVAVSLPAVSFIWLPSLLTLWKISLAEHAQLFSGKIFSSCIMILIIQCTPAKTRQSQPSFLLSRNSFKWSIQCPYSKQLTNKTDNICHSTLEHA